MYHETRSVYSDIHLPESNNLVSPRPITDLGVRNALKKDPDLASLRVPPKDEKILGLITQRGESEIIQRKQRMKHALARNQEKLDSDKLKLEKDKHHRANIDLTREEDRQKVVVKKLEKQKKRLKRKTEMLAELEKSNRRAEKRIRKQRRQREKKIQKISTWESNNKARQEKNWLEHHSSDYEKKITEQREHDERRKQAWEKREDLIKEEHEKIAKHNKEERLYFTERYVVYEKKHKASEKALVAKIERRFTKAQSNYEKHVKEKLKDITKDTKKEEERLQNALKVQQKLEDQHHKRMMKMLEKTQKGIEQANATIAEAFDKLSNHVRQEREEKEQVQLKKMKKLKKEEHKRTKQITKDIEVEEERIKKKQEERQKIIEKTRHIANDSRTLRSKLLNTYGAENFDRKAFRVERFNSLGTRPSTQDWNTSSISLV